MVKYDKVDAAELFLFIFRHSKLKSLTQFPALNDEKYFYSTKLHISIDQLSTFQKLF